MAEADRLTINAGTSASAWMENAGRGVAQEVVRLGPERRLSVLCGPWNNGGDEIVAACHLASAGWNVRVALLGTRIALEGSASPPEQLDVDSRWTIRRSGRVGAFGAARELRCKKPFEFAIKQNPSEVYP